jgi:hypothetical protein
MSERRSRDGEEAEALPLTKAAQLLLEECRMVLPGIQALFGFQLVVVFSAEFARQLTGGEQRLHLAAIALSAVAAGIIMTPASLHRHQREITDLFVRVTSRLLLASMVPLALSICLDFYLIGRMVTGREGFALVSAALLAFLGGLWFVLPRARSLQRLIGGPDRPRAKEDR